MIKKIILSFFILFHLFAIMLGPNEQSYLGSRVTRVMTPYFNVFEFAVRWGFFAPTPGPPPVFIEYEALGEGGKTIKAGSWPERTETFFLRERINRRLSVARFLMNSNERTERMMGPYYCRLYPEAQSVRLWRMVETTPAMEDVLGRRRHFGDGANPDRKFVTQYLCASGDTNAGNANK